MNQAMTNSTTILNAQIGFLDTHLAVIHIPLSAYPLFIQPILQLLLINNNHDENGEILESSRPWTYWYPFVNIAVTPNECSIVCPRHQADLLFAPIIERADKSATKRVSISNEDYAAIMIGGEGLEAGQRVTDLTAPLAMAGISIFFITSYWSDFILVPLKSRPKVIRALEERGFVFEADGGESGHMTNPASPMLHAHHRSHSSPSSYDFPPPPGTPPPRTVSELELRTFKQLNRNHIKPSVDHDIDLVTCAGVKDSTASSSATNFSLGKLQLGLVKCFTNLTPPRFLSLTLTDIESASITLERGLLTLFSNDGEDVLLGKDGPQQIPITLDLSGLPLESSGIVCGVSSKLINGMKFPMGKDLFNVSYLSTAKAGHVIVYEDELQDALRCLESTQENGVH
ncbi:Hypothetical protein R9X50_00673400 [Acrodontium crateriforme]|uniref:CASTOR ACT domain-containing protein n=1 Tax=Acrodontium crateriforme TaxID=150365 RepID=A0AAQ3MC57_9PEZI|nr:Hypothetical protein R9X50_00673400 [Acrodontium crateriforme]